MVKYAGRAARTELALESRVVILNVGSAVFQRGSRLLEEPERTLALIADADNVVVELLQAPGKALGVAQIAETVGYEHFVADSVSDDEKYRFGGAPKRLTREAQLMLTAFYRSMYPRI